MKLQHRLVSIALCASLLVNAPLGAAIAQGELISTIQGYTPVEQLAVGDTILTQIHNCWFPTTHVTAIAPHTANAVYYIQTDAAELRVSGDQLLYDAQLSEWVQAKNVSTSSVFLNSAHEHIPCTGVEVINEPTAAYTLSVASPHTFYLSEANILVHNMDPIFVMDGAAKAVPAFVQTAQAVGTGIMMITSWLIHKRREKKTQPAAKITTPPSSNPGNGNDQKEDEEEPTQVHNMKEFFKKTKFGRKMKKLLKKTNNFEQGQRRYRVKENIKEYGLKKGDELYLDAAHKNHLEVFDKFNRPKTVLNLNGTPNWAKISKIANRTIQ